ncbi:MAG: O-antigen ligase family protein [Planctomycetota bacterium]
MWSRTDTALVPAAGGVARGLVMLALVFALAVIGAVEVWAQPMLALTVLAAALIGAWGDAADRAHHGGAPQWCLAALALIGVVQLVPLPIAVVKLISPATAAWWQWSLPAAGACPLRLYPGATRVAVGRIVTFALAFSVFARVTRVRDARRAGAILAAIGVLAAAMSVVDWWGGFGWWQYHAREAVVPGRLAGPFVNPNHFASFLGLIVGLLIACRASRPTLARTLARHAALVIVALALALTGSRLGLAVVAAAVLIALVLEPRARRAPLLAVVGVLLIGVVLVRSPWCARVDGLAAGDGRSRVMLLHSVAALSRDFIAAGSGLGTFAHLFPAYQPVSLRGTWDHAHNDLLELLVDGGVLAAVLALAFVATWYRRQLRSLASLSVRRRAMLVGLIAGSSALLLHSMGDFPLQIPANALLLAAMMGMADGLSRSARSARA